MLEMDADIALLQEPLYRTFGGSLAPSALSGGAVVCAVQSASSPIRALILHRPSFPAVFLEELSTPDCVVVQISLNNCPCLLVSAYFDCTREIAEDLRVIIAAAPGGRVLIHADSNARSPVWFDVIENKRGKKLVDWLGDNGLTLLNTSGPATFVRRTKKMVADGLTCRSQTMKQLNWSKSGVCAAKLTLSPITG
jgi:hypothetical protein